MKKVTILLLLLALCSNAYSQRVFRNQFTLYDTREDALNRNHLKTINHMFLNFASLGSVGKTEIAGTKIVVPASWNDYNVYLHIENTFLAYDIAIDGKIIASSEDPYTPADFLISQYLKQGDNDIVILLRGSSYWRIDEGIPFSARKQFDGCYLFAQHRTAVYDYNATITQSDNGQLTLNMDIIVNNDFNFEETVSVGYDIYTPERKLVDYAVRDIVVPGRSRDTLKVKVNLGAESKYLWSAEKPSLYRTNLYIKRNGKPFEYLSVRIGAGSTTFKDGIIYRNGEPIYIRSFKYNALKDRTACRKDILELKKKGFNTLIPDCPQPQWFYEVCDDLGIYVIESAAINPTSNSDDRKIGGTPSNNPKFVDQYLLRVKSMYYRSCNHACIIAYSIGGEKAGNGYCMYKAYQWLKSVEKNRPIICNSADGEWNTDL